MLYRKLTDFIENYYDEFSSALLLTGARQTGKTFAARKFGEKYESFIEINFIRQPEAKTLLREASNPEDIYLRISMLSKKNLVPGKTLIFFDEIQECESIVTAIKFLVDDAKYRFILSGSLLGVELKGIRSQPVGYMGIKEVFPLDFEEFALNVGVSDKVLGRVKECFDNRISIDDFINSRLLELFKIYILTGGMPAAVKKYIETNNMREVEQAQRDIVNMYKADIAKYAADNEKLVIKEIFDIIPSELDAKNKRFVLKQLNQHAKYERYKNSFLWLKDAGVAIPVYNLQEPKIPLKLSEQRNLFKLFSNDVGLLASQYAGNIQVDILSDIDSINVGAIYENVVAQELAAHEIQPYYFNSKRQGEVDFVIAPGNKAIPIEVKSGKDYTRHNAMNNLLATDAYGIQEGFVFSNSNLRKEGRLTYAPIYTVTFIRKTVAPSSLPFDLTGLA